jgi:hypothetical protein
MPKYKVTFYPSERKIWVDEEGRIPLMMTNLEPSNRPTSINKFIAAMSLPHTDVSPLPKVMDGLYRMRKEYRPKRMIEGQL